MKLTFLGHASWLVQSRRAAVLLDPVLSDFRGGHFTISPTRALRLDAMPAIDAVVVTHRHRDHFDPASLLRLDRAVTVFCPRDPVILHALGRLGFADVHTVRDWSREQFRDLTLLFTRSSYRAVPEYGVLCCDGAGFFWNQVDTGITADTVERVTAAIGGPVDLVAHAYQPMCETDVVDSLSPAFPAEKYAALLHTAKMLAPRAIVPASNGYRVSGEHAWINAYKFPIGRERFVRDLATLLPETRTFIPNPGDVLQLGAGPARLRPQAAARGFVRTVEDDCAELRRFDPTRPKPALRDANPGRLTLRRLRRSVRYLFEERFLPASQRTSPGHPMLALKPLIECRVIYPDRAVESWALDFTGAKPTMGVRAVGDASDHVLEIAASTLHGLMTGQTRSDIVLLTGQYRQFARAYRVVGGRLLTQGQLAPPEFHGAAATQGGALGLLLGWLEEEPDAEVRLVDAELDRLLSPPGRRAIVRPFWDRVLPG